MKAVSPAAYNERMNYGAMATSKQLPPLPGWMRVNLIEPRGETGVQR